LTRKFLIAHFVFKVRHQLLLSREAFQYGGESHLVD